MKNVNAAIGRAAMVVTKDQDIFDGIDKEILAQRVAEAKFLRALYLFEIVKNWGQAPLILEEPTSPSTTSQLDSGSDLQTNSGRFAGRYGFFSSHEADFGELWTCIKSGC